MADKIYPGEIRMNNFSTMYCEMAMESYYNASISFNRIKESGYSCACYDDRDAMEKSIVSTIVFSAMTLEAFINDYAAACLGDSDFYDNFEKLSFLSKFELVARFILKSNIDKSKAYYSYLKALFRQRDSYIHNKSKRSSFQGYRLEEFQKINKMNRLDDFINEPPSFDVGEINDEMKMAIDALKAIKNIAIYFDERDSNIHAIVKLFDPYGTFLGFPEKKQYKLLVLQLLGIGADKL